MAEPGNSPTEGSGSEKLDLRRPQDLPSVEVLRAENCARRWRVLHETYAICTVSAIARPAEWTYRGRVHPLPAGGITLMEPGEVHANTRATDPALFRVLFVPQPAMAEAARELGVAAPPHFGPALLERRTHAWLWSALAGLHASIEEAATPLERQSRLAACLRGLLEQCVEHRAAEPTARDDPLPVRRAVEFLRASVVDQVGLDELVHAAGAANRFQLIHAFTAAVGLPPHAYQTQLRVIEAKALLAAGLPPGQVAAEVGFADQSHLTRHFRRVVGVGPGAYRRAATPGRRSYHGAAARTFKTV